MANDKHKLAKQQRDEWNRRLFEQWQREHGVKEPESHLEEMRRAQQERIAAALEQAMRDAAEQQAETRRRREEAERQFDGKGKGKGKDNTQQQQHKPPAEYPVKFLPSHGVYGGVRYNTGRVLTLEAAPLELAEARLAEHMLARPLTLMQCVCYCTREQNNCDGGKPDGSDGFCNKPAFAFVSQTIVSGLAQGLPTCEECTQRFVKRYGMLIVDFLDNPPDTRTFDYREPDEPEPFDPDLDDARNDIDELRDSMEREYDGEDEQEND